MIAQILWQSPDLGPAAMGLVALLAVTVVWLYPPQTRGVPRRWRWAMPLLRGLAVAALAAAVAQPIVLRPRSKGKQGTVALLIDRSHSMSVVDRQRTPAELVSLAAGLGVLPEHLRAEAGGGVRARLESVRALTDQLLPARSEAEYARISGRGLAAAAARVRDATEQLRVALADLPAVKSITTEKTSAEPSPADELAKHLAELKKIPSTLDEPAVRSLGITLDAATRALAYAQRQEDEKLFHNNAVVRSICTALREQSRAQLLETGLSQQPNGMLSALPEGTPISAFAFADSVTPLDWTPGEPIALDIGGTRTDIGGAMRGVLSRMSGGATGTGVGVGMGGAGASAGKPLQAIVLFSDGRQVGGDIEALASDVSSSGVPVFAVQTSASSSETQAQDVSILNVSAPREARIGQTIAVRAELRAQALRGSSLDVRLDVESIRLVKRVPIDEEGNGVAEFQLQLARAGPASLVVSVPALPGGESSDENNRFERSIRVGADAARVLVIAGNDAGRQLAALQAALTRAPWVELETVPQNEAAGLTARTIAAQDVVILCDLPPGELSLAQWTALDELMRHRGGSVIVCAGQHAPVEYLNHEQARELIPLDPNLKPAWRSWPGDEPQFRIVPAGNVELESAADLEAWRQLAGVSRYMPLTPFREGLTVRPILVERESSAPVLTDTRIGLGHVYVIGTDQSWRWRATTYANEERDLFWTQLVRLAAGEPYAAVEGNAALDADDVTPEPDQPFTVRARMLDSSGQPMQTDKLPLRIFRGESETALVREVTMGSVQPGSGRYEANVSGLPVGRYTLHVDPPEDPTLESRAEPVTLGITVAPHLEAEMANLSGDERLLRRIADASGGGFLTFDQFSQLPRRLEENRQKQNPLVEYTLWDSPYLFGFVLACLSAEWALRKKFGLA